MKKTILLALFVLMGVGFASAQNRVTGTVTGADDGQPLPYVTILVKGTNTIATSGADGKYAITVPEGSDVLVFSFSGLKTEEITVGSRSIIDVIMTADATVLDDAIIVGYGTARRPGTTIGTISTVTTETIKNKPVANVMDALQGRVAGLQVYTSSGEPTTLSSVRLHGVGSLAGSTTPLYVVDGIPIEPSTMLALNSNDFESISILKDASATSIYGSRGANGVIFITTKKGRLNQDGTVTLRLQYGLSSMADKSFYENLMSADELFDYFAATGIYSQADIDYLKKTYARHDTDWYDVYYQDNAPTLQGDVSIQGGSNKSTYFLSMSYMDQEGIARRSSYNRLTVRANLESRVKDWMKVGVSLTSSYDKRSTNPYGTNSVNRGLFWLTPPFTSQWDDDGKRLDLNSYTGWYHPEYLASKMTEPVNNMMLNASGFAEITPIEGLTIKTLGGLDAFDRRGTSTRLPSYKGAPGNGTISEYFIRNAIGTITNTVEYKFDIKDDHKVAILGGQEGVGSKFSNFRANGTGLTDDRLVQLGHTTGGYSVGSYSTYPSKTSYVYLSFFGRADYSYKNKYFADISVRNDQSSRFGKNNKSASFVSGGLMWNAKREDFLKDVSWLTDLTVRASTGTQGNSVFGTSYYYDYTHLSTIGTNQYEGSTGFALSAPGNSDLTWEKQQKTTIAASATAYSRYTLGLEFYIRKTKSMFMDVPFPFTSGFESVYTNIGTMKNTGIDISLSADIIKNTDWLVNAYANMNYNWNKITELFLGMDQWTRPNTGVSYKVGSPIEYYYPLYAGVDPADGRQMWYVPGADISKPNRDPNNTTKVFDEAALMQSTGKQRYAPFTGGFGLNANWKGISLQADFAFALNKWLINNDVFFSENPASFPGYNQSKNILDYWKQAGDITNTPRFGQVREFDDHMLEDASYLRLKNLTLSYSVPSKWLEKTKFFQGVRVFATGRNLITATSYTGPDPEPDTNLSLGVYPNTRQYVFGIEVTF